MLARLKTLVPQPLIQAYHLVLARLAALVYGHPSDELVVIGVTGTKGKTTTSYLIARALEASGFKTGCATTALFKIGEREWLNTTKMTMLGRFALQRFLRQMVQAGCRYAVVETSSQGLIQHRHVGINYDLAVFTNLTPEHLEAHGGFENYRAAKRLLFEHLARCPIKTIDGQKIPKAAVLNADSPEAEFFATTPGLPRIEWFGVRNPRGLSVSNLELSENGLRFTVDGVAFELQLPGPVNVENALAAIAVAKVLGLKLQTASNKLQAVTSIPGRYERVEAGQPWTVIVDYAHEPESLRRLYEAAESLPHRRIIHVLGAAGGGRDTAKRAAMGALAGQSANIVIVTNEDPYDEDPRAIIEQVAAGARSTGKKDNESLYVIDDRQAAIDQAMRLAQAGDLVLLTGKGSERVICVANGQKIPWNETEAATESIKSIKS